MDARGLVDLVVKRGKAGTATQTIIKAVMPKDARFCLVAMSGHPERIELLNGAEHARLTKKFGPLPGLAYIQEVRLQVIPLVVNHLLELLLRGQTQVNMEYTTRADECVFLMPFDGSGHMATIETCGINQRDLLRLVDSLTGEGKPAASAPGTPDYAMLATPDQLIAAFGSMSDMNARWFRSMKDRPELKAAVVVDGVKGRKGAPPLLDVFKVLQYLLRPKREGKAILPETGWRLLKRHFPKVYAKYEVSDPNATA